MPQYRTMGLPKLTGHTDKDIKNLRDLFYQQDEQLRYLFEHLGTDIASEIWGNDNQSVKIKIDEDGIIAEFRESLDGDLESLSTKINITAGKINTTVSRVENIERDYVSDEVLSGILSEYVTDDDIDNVYLSLKTEIDQNAEAIALRATKEYVAESLNGYVTEAELKISADGILATVSKNYVSDEVLDGILSEYVTDDDIDNVYLSLKTEIDQNAEAIALRATKEYVAESLNGYVTEAELSAELKISSDGVLTTVSKSYATTGAVNTAQNTANAAGAAAATAQNTADSAKNTADAVAANLSNNYYAKTTIDQKFDGITLKYTDSAGNETSFKLANGAIDITLLKNQVDDASKTATNFISMTSDGGVEVGNKSGGNWTGYRSQMLADSFNILDADGTILAKYGANDIHLGMNSSESRVYFCGDEATLGYNADENHMEIYTPDGLLIEGGAIIRRNYPSPNGVYNLRSGIDAYDSSVKLLSEIYTNGARSAGSSITLSGNMMTLQADGYILSSKIRGQSTGGSWYMGRDYALLASTSSATETQYFPLIDAKSQSGDWSMGCLGDSLYFVFTTDGNYNNSDNTTSRFGIRYDGMPLLGGSTPLIEYGTWTPTIYNRSGSNPTVTYKNRSGYYYRIGNMVYVIAYISPVISANSGNYAAVSGLPFTSYGVQQGLEVFEGFNVFSHGNSTYHVTAHVISGTGDVHFYSPTGADSLNWIVNSGETTYNPNLRFSGWYRIA